MHQHNKNKNSKRIRICLSYDGTSFWGWQKQPNAPMTIQGILEDRLAKIYNRKIAVIGSGRTDRGVHALNQWAHFDLPNDADIKKLEYKLQRMTPDELAIKGLWLTDSSYHAQISALSKCYFYRIDNHVHLNPFQKRYSWPIQRPLNLNYLQEISSYILGEHDFSSFQSKGTIVSSPIREIFISRWIQKKNGILEYQIKGNGFLKQMVRNIVGTFVKMHDLKTTPKEIIKLISHKNRRLAAAPAPASGLFLSSVQYPKSLDNKCRKL
jgi:tRNA pseudouridine38-40 synthase